VADEGGRSPTLEARLLALMDERGGVVTRADLGAYEPRWEEPVRAEYAGLSLSTRAALNSPLPVLAALPGSDPVSLALALRGDERDGDTTNLTVVDRDGNTVVLTTSLGLGSGDWVPGLDLHLNSMLGEADLLVGELSPGDRMASMMSPTIGIDDRGVAIAAGAAGGTRLRSALVQVLAGVLDEGLSPDVAVDRPRLHPVGDLVHLEPGFPDRVHELLERAGFELRLWPERHHYFGGVSVVGRSGAAADPRRSGAALEPPQL
jgi:gamma-glutamyltranspeptidase/glutathione hydrolase